MLFAFSLRNPRAPLYQPPESGDDVYFIVESGVKIGSKSTSLPAFDMGSWPAGVNIHLQVRENGRIQGKGGQGGVYAQSSGPGNPGLPGGTALLTTVPIIIENDPDGRIWAGAGGGGGSGLITFGASGFGNGGGGAGFDGGDGGKSGSPAFDASPGTPDAGGDGFTSGLSGGAGGDPGQPGNPGQSGTAFGGTAGGAGGAAGAAIDGDSLVTYTEAGDIRGGLIN